MNTKINSKLLSAKLANLFKEINSTFGHTKELILEAYNLAIQENRTPQEAKQLLLDNITVFKKTQLYAYLPSECKDPVKQKAGHLSHKTEVSVPIPEQNTEPEQSDPDNHTNLPLDRADNYLVKLQAENITLKKEIENISNNVIPEALMKKDRQIGELQREKAELIRTHRNEIEQLKSRVIVDLNESDSEVLQLDDPQPGDLMMQTQESTSKMMQKTYYKNLSLIGDVTLPLQIHVNPEKDECFLEVDKKIAQEVFVRACKELK